MLEIHDLGLCDAEKMLQLNNAHALETSLLDQAGLSSLLRHAFYCRGIDHGAAALLIALDQHAQYENPNFNWFRKRYRAFVYVDRVIVADFVRGQGLARRLYLDLFTKARHNGHNRIVCEINIDPPNPASDAFHLAMGFSAVGQAVIHNGKKEVRYFERILT